MSRHGLGHIKLHVHNCTALKKMYVSVTQKPKEVGTKINVFSEFHAKQKQKHYLSLGFIYVKYLSIDQMFDMFPTKQNYTESIFVFRLYCHQILQGLQHL